MQHFLKTILLVLVFKTGWTQTEVLPPEYIKTIIFKGTTEGDQFPIVRLGETFTFSFDDITAQEEDYYYKITHHDYNWEQSNLLKPQYLQGTDNLRITNYTNSYGTLQPYSNYQLTLPNKNTKLKVSGNYILSIYNGYDELVFTRRFVVYTDATSVGVAIKNTRDLSLYNTHQTTHISIDLKELRVVNPKQDVKIAILKNYQWSTAKFNIKPQFITGTRLQYKYDKETRFAGGNEYLYFDNSDLRVSTSTIQKVAHKDLYHHYLYTNTARRNQPYTYNPDINGDFTIRTLQGQNSNIEAEYTQVYFSLAYDEYIALNDVYVYGNYNNYALTKENKLVYNEATAQLEKTILLKQGFYNYKFVMVDANGHVNDTAISGSHRQTENNYLVLVYHRNFGDTYDSVVGVGSGNSSTITN
jgi:hypothetical protein